MWLKKRKKERNSRTIRTLLFSMTFEFGTDACFFFFCIVLFLSCPQMTTKPTTTTAATSAISPSNPYLEPRGRLDNEERCIQVIRTWPAL